LQGHEEYDDMLGLSGFRSLRSSEGTFERLVQGKSMMETTENFTTEFDENDVPLEDDELLGEVVRALLDQPCPIRIERRLEGDLTALYIHIPPEHRGKIIGRQGRTITALRTIFSIVGAIDSCHLVVKMAN